MEPHAPAPAADSSLPRTMRQYAIIFAILAVVGGVGFAFSGIGLLTDYQTAGNAWLMFVIAIVVVLQCGWFYGVSKAIAELLERTRREV